MVRYSLNRNPKRMMEQNIKCHFYFIRSILNFDKDFPGKARLYLRWRSDIIYLQFCLIVSVQKQIDGQILKIMNKQLWLHHVKPFLVPASAKGVDHQSPLNKTSCRSPRKQLVVSWTDAALTYATPCPATSWVLRSKQGRPLSTPLYNNGQLLTVNIAEVGVGDDSIELENPGIARPYSKGKKKPFPWGFLEWCIQKGFHA